MAAVQSLGGQPPAGLAGELAPVIPLNPSQAEKGFLDQDLLGPELAGLVRGLGGGVARLVHGVFGQHHLHSEALPKGVVVSEGDSSARLLVTEPAAGSGVKPNEAKNTVLLPGLTEFGDLGSALRLHVAYAESHPDRRVITIPTEDVSHGGHRSDLDHTAEDRLRLVAARNLSRLPHVTHDGEVELDGTSFGSYLATLMAEQDLAADPHKQVGIGRLRLLSSAVVASNVAPHEDFRDPDIDEGVFRHELTQAFFDHVGKQLLHMGLRKPGDLWACSAIVGGYALAPLKLPRRLRAIGADFRSVQEGMGWDILNYVAGALPIDVLGGALDPLIQVQIPQWDKLAELHPGRIRQTVVPDRGHLMTVDARGTVAHLDAMELPLAA